MAVERTVWVALAFILLTVRQGEQRSTVYSSTYQAAVVEFSPMFANANDSDALDAAATFRLNSDTYVELIQRFMPLGGQGADIIVFPEAGLETLTGWHAVPIPEPGVRVVPCEDRSGRYDDLAAISCAARDNLVYVVVSVLQASTNGSGGGARPDNGTDRHTTVVFDRNGAIVQTYGPGRSFGDQLPEAPPPGLATFETDFNVTFGIFSSLDLLSQRPAVDLVRQAGVTDVVFPSAWISEAPFLAAVQTQAWWSFALDVNLLSAGYAAPELGRGGSGIYAGRGGPQTYLTSPGITFGVSVAVAKMGYPQDTNSSEAGRVSVLAGADVIALPNPKSRNARSVTKISAGRLTTNAERESGDGKSKPMFSNEDDAKDAAQTLETLDSRLFTQTYEDLSMFASQLLTASSAGQPTPVCHGGFCCQFEVDGDFSTDHQAGVRSFYRVVAFDGQRWLNGQQVGVQVCALVACADTGTALCGSNADVATPTTFSAIQVNATFRNGNSVQGPTTLGADNDVLLADNFAFECAQTGCGMQLTVATDDIRTFGIYGRNFALDRRQAGALGALPR